MHALFFKYLYFFKGLFDGPIPSKYVVPGGEACGVGSFVGGALGNGEVFAPISLPYGPNSFFSEEDPILFVDKFVGGKSSRMAKSKVVDLLKTPYIVEGLEVIMPNDLMSEAISNLKLPLVDKFIAFCPIIDQVRRWADSI